VAVDAQAIARTSRLIVAMGPHKPLRRAQWHQGVRAMLPGLPGAFVWGVVAGLAMINAGLSALQASVMAVVVYSGTAQMVALPLIMSGAAHSIIFVAVFLGGVRFLIYSAAMAHNVRRLRGWQRFHSAYLTIDAAAAMYLQRRANRHKPFAHRMTYLAGMNVTVWALWMLGLGLGIVGAAWLPSSTKFAYLGVLAMMVMLLPMLKTRPALVCTLVAGVVSLMAAQWPYKLGILAGVVAGVIAGVASSQVGNNQNKAQPT
jgi:predicted branched-subunit amino acid permease